MDLLTKLQPASKPSSEALNPNRHITHTNIDEDQTHDQQATLMAHELPRTLPAGFDSTHAAIIDAGRALSQFESCMDMVHELPDTSFAGFSSIQDSTTDAVDTWLCLGATQIADISPNTHYATFGNIHGGAPLQPQQSMYIAHEFANVTFINPNDVWLCQEASFTADDSLSTFFATINSSQSAPIDADRTQTQQVSTNPMENAEIISYAAHELLNISLVMDNSQTNTDINESHPRRELPSNSDVHEVQLQGQLPVITNTDKAGAGRTPCDSNIDEAQPHRELPTVHAPVEEHVNETWPECEEHNNKETKPPETRNTLQGPEVNLVRASAEYGIVVLSGEQNLEERTTFKPQELNFEGVRVGRETSVLDLTNEPLSPAQYSTSGTSPVDQGEHGNPSISAINETAHQQRRRRKAEKRKKAEGSGQPARRERRCGKVKKRGRRGKDGPTSEKMVIELLSDDEPMVAETGEPRGGV
jgi:hypothetical protein